MYEYPFGNGQQLNLDWFLAEWKNLLAAWEAEKNGIDGALQAEIDRAEAALADVFAARDAAAQSAANALESKNAAAQSASDASGYLATVRADATTAHDAAQNAAQSESNAAESAQTALASKNTAANSERNAAQSEANALASKNAAAQSASDADASKRAAAQSAADALADKNAAAQSASDAEDAAASVEASAQQITTNANGISDLKESISNSGLFAFPLFENLFNFNESIIATHRNFDISKNHVKITGTLTSSFFRGVPLTGTNCRELVLSSVADISSRIDDNDFVEIKAINTIPFLKYAIIVTHNTPTSGLGEFTIVLATKDENNQLITKTISSRSSPFAYTLDDNTVAEAFQHGNLAVYLISRGIQDQFVEDITISFIPITNTSALTALTLEH